MTLLFDVYPSLFVLCFIPGVSLAVAVVLWLHSIKPISGKP